MAELTKSELNYATSYWCLTQKITSADLGCAVKPRHDGSGRYIEQPAHPAIDDVIVLIKFIDANQRHFTPKHRIAVWHLWTWTYTERKPLGNKIKKLSNIENDIRKIKYHTQQRAIAQRLKIKALRQNPTA